MDDDALVGYAELKPLFGITYSRTHIKRKEKAGEFPRRLKTSKIRGARFFYRLRDIREWLNSLRP
jgi:predicted DNA-binding transcriptional regulator AlpA